MNPEKLEMYLGEVGGERLRVFTAAETGSTCDDARAFVNSDEFNSAIDAALFTADCQTGGRGRQGKTFASPRGGLYMTLAMRTMLPLESVVCVTSCAAVAVARAVAEVSGAECGIKWVNDVYLDGGKLAGILVESINDYAAMQSKYIIIGVGINVGDGSLDLENNIGAASLAGGGYSAELELLCAATTRELLKIRENGFDFSKYADEYRRRSIVIGQEITFVRNGAARRGTAEGIDCLGGLIVRCGDVMETLDSGEITIRTADDKRK